MRTRKKRKGRIGSSFRDFLKEEGMYEEASAVAIKRVLAWELEQVMTRGGQVVLRRFARSLPESLSCSTADFLDPASDSNTRWIPASRWCSGSLRQNRMPF